jgi:hypothetical protein
MLDGLDFAPEPVADGNGSADRIRLRHCPFLELVEPVGARNCAHSP